jgi:hypothetical protein
MRLFDIVPNELFSILSSPNRLIYSAALAVLYDAFRENLKIQKNTFFTMIRSRLADELARSEFSEDGISEEEAQDLSGRARFLIRKLKERGWIELERGDDFEEYVILPDYSIKILELFSELTLTTPALYSIPKLPYKKSRVIVDKRHDTGFLLKGQTTIWQRENVT